MLDYTQHWVHYPFTNIRYRSSTLSTSISWIKSSYIQADFGIWHVLLLKPTSVAKTQRKIGGTEYSKRGGTENGYFPTKRKTSSVPPRRLCCFRTPVHYFQLDIVHRDALLVPLGGGIGRCKQTSRCTFRFTALPFFCASATYEIARHL